MALNRRQTSNATGHNRHPGDFAVARLFLENEFPGDNDARVLSFGCSTGEELLSIRDSVVLDRERQVIVGVEIMPDIRSKAIENCAKHSNIVIFSNEQFEADSCRFAIIFCMAVFCIFPLTDKMKSMPDTFSFRDFENDMTRLAERLIVGGLLFIKDANYIFEHTAVFANKFRIFEPDLQDKWMVPKFDLNGKRIDSSIPVYRCFKRIE